MKRHKKKLKSWISNESNKCLCNKRALVKKLLDVKAVETRALHNRQYNETKDIVRKAKKITEKFCKRKTTQEEKSFTAV